MAKSNLKQSPVSGQRQSDKTFTIDVSVVGLGFRLKADVRRALAANVDAAMDLNVGGINVKLVREQENRADINAIRVIHDGAGALRGRHLGYLRADVAAQFAPLIDDGDIVFKSGLLVALDPDDAWKTGILSVTFRDKRRKKAR